MDKLEKIIEIPEGYEARIEGNKVVLEPKESEDERTRKSLLAYIKGESKRLDTKKWIAYLEKQKEQKPAEWSEEDERLLEKLITYVDIECFDRECNGQDVIDWLKSLRPLPHWKPSEEQMEWLESAVRLSTDKPYIHEIIISLYEQLKKL